MTEFNKIVHSRIRLILLTILVPLFLINCGSSEPNVKTEPPVTEIANEWVIYEVYPGLYEKGNAFNSISNQLDNIKALGVNVVWLMPIYDQGVLKGIGSPYCIKDYKKINSLSLVYSINEPTGDVDEWELPKVKEKFTYTIEEALIKLFALRKKDRKSVV